MPTTTPNRPTTSLLGKTPKPLRLRIEGGDRNGQIVSLKRPKCLLGAAEQCDLHISGTDPVRVLLLRGARRTIVRTLSGRDRLNGKPFTEAVLLPGDRLDLDVCSLRVLKPGEEKARRRQTSSTLVAGICAATGESSLTTTAAAGPLTPDIADLLDIVRRQVEQLVESNKQHWHQLQETLATERDAQSAAAVDLSGLQGLLEAQRSALATRDEEVIARGERIAEQLQHELDQLTKQWKLMEDRYLALGQSRPEWQDGMDKQLRAIVTQLKVLESSRDAIEAERAALREELERHFLQLRQEREALAAEKTDLQQKRSEWEAARQELGDERIRLAAADGALADARSPEPGKGTTGPIEDSAPVGHISAHLDQILREQREAIEQTWDESLAKRLREIEHREVLLAQQSTTLEAREQSIATQMQQLDKMFVEHRENLERDLAIQRDALAVQRQALERCESQISQQTRNLTEMQESLARRLSEWNAAPAQVEPSATWRESLEQRAGELDRRAQELDRLRAEFETRLAAAEADIRAQRDGLTESRRQLDEERREFQRQIAERHRQSLQSVTPAQKSEERRFDECEEMPQSGLWPHGAETVSCWQPRTQAETGQQGLAPEADGVFERLAAAGILKRGSDQRDPASGEVPINDEGCLDTLANPSSTYAEAVPQQERLDAWDETVSSASADEEESIDQYMAKLLERARQNSSQAAAHQPSVAARVIERVGPPQHQDTEITSPQGESTLADAEPSVFERRRERPKPAVLNHDLSAMRELANLSARSHLERHYRRQQQYIFGTKVTIFVVSLVTGLFGVFKGVQPGTIFWYASLCSLAIAGAWGIQLGVIIFRIVRGPASTCESPSEGDPDSECVDTPIEAPILD